MAEHEVCLGEVEPEKLCAGIAACLQGKIQAKGGVRIETAMRCGIYLSSSSRHSPLGLCRYREPEKNDDRSVEPQNIFISESANAFADLRFWDGGDLVHH